MHPVLSVDGCVPVVRYDCVNVLQLRWKTTSSEPDRQPWFSTGYYASNMLILVIGIYRRVVPAYQLLRSGWPERGGGE